MLCIRSTGGKRHCSSVYTDKIKKERVRTVLAKLDGIFGVIWFLFLLLWDTYALQVGRYENGNGMLALLSSRAV